MIQTMKVRPATLADIASMIQLERQCLGASHWTEGHYQQLFGGESGGAERLALVIETSAAGNLAQGESRERRPLLGFLIAHQVPPEWELENIAVDPSMRRTGLGSKLLAALLVRARQTNSESVFLEVRESNQTARHFYEKAGFRQTGRRKSYYAQPFEDAILYQLSLKMADN